MFHFLFETFSLKTSQYFLNRYPTSKMEKHYPLWPCSFYYKIIIKKNKINQTTQILICNLKLTRLISTQKKKEKKKRMMTRFKTF